MKYLFGFLIVALIASIALNIRVMQPTITSKYISIYKEQSQNKSEVLAVIYIDSILSLNKEYRQLKQKEYGLCMSRGNFNLPPSKQRTDDVMDAIGAKKTDIGTRNFFMSFFRLAIIFRIVDELNDPRMPSKEQLCKDIMQINT